MVLSISIANNRYSCPSRCLYLGGSETHQIARRLASLLPELCVAESPVMVHCLGLNGVNVYNHLRKVSQSFLFIYLLLFKLSIVNSD